MLIRIGLENNVEGRSIAWMLDFPGCFAYGQDGPEAILNVPRAVLAYRNWIGRHTAQSWLADLGDFDVRLVETFECYDVNDALDRVPSGQGYEVNAFFQDDWKPLSEEDVRRGLLLLEWSRADMHSAFAGQTPDQLNQDRPGERWPINGILNHVGRAEWWYMDNLGLAGMESAQLSKVPTERLSIVRARLRQVLPTLVGSKLVLGKGGEFWSPRKLLRRVLWHELDHVEHIRKLVQV
jgi:hypothetical protein